MEIFYVAIFWTLWICRVQGQSNQPQDPLYRYFIAVAGQDGQISADELQRSLTESGISGSYQSFNLDTCRLLITMLDRDMSGSMSFPEFQQLWSVLNQWMSIFSTYDRDRSGTVEAQELQQALVAMGFNLSPNALNIIVRRYSVSGRIPFDEFIGCFVRLRSLTDQFQRRDTSRTGHASFQYDDFIQVTMSV